MSVMPSWPLKMLLMRSIRARIFFGCLSLTTITVVMGLLLQTAQRTLGATALDIYDNGYIPMTYLRSAQSIVLSITNEQGADVQNETVSAVQLQSVLDALDVARERAMSSRGARAAQDLFEAVAVLQEGFEKERIPSQQQLTFIEQQFDVAVQIYTADGFRLRQNVELLVEKTQRQTYAAMIISVIFAVIITLLLSGAIVPSIRYAVKIASSIASGRLDNRIDQRSLSETGTLLSALSTMQDNIAEKIAHIESLMAKQASNYAAEINLQNARFEVALNNMTLGLCMFDAEGKLQVHNRRFIDLFVGDGSRGSIDNWLVRLRPKANGFTSNDRLCIEDGRIIAITEEPMSDGGLVVTYEDITERHKSEVRLSHMARHDSLTGLPNRLLFREQLQEGLSRARACAGSMLSLLCLDLDRFKSVNDTLGHLVGDALLQEASLRLRNEIGITDGLARLGGDEFAVIHYSPTNVPEAHAIASRLIDVMAAPFCVDGHRITIGVSIGIAESVEGNVSYECLLKSADLALYLAKADGRGIYRCFEPKMDAQIQAKRTLELDLREAILQNQFELFYQPLLDVKSRQIVCFEALLRWRHPIQGIVSPAEFIPLSEETGLINELGRWVINTACSDARYWPNEIKLAVNLSPLQFRSSNLVSDVSAALDRAGLPGSRLDLEITESLMLLDDVQTITTLHDLRGLGISISMDDFGTGYSSLSYLRRFPFDKIKIDQSFIRNMENGGEEHAIVVAFISLGCALRKKVVAEGVETEEQFDLLARAGCQEVQGYLFSTPQPAGAICSLIQDFASAQITDVSQQKRSL